MREEDSWVPTKEVNNKCATCAYVVTEPGVSPLASCEYGQPWFPKAVACRTYEPDEA